jgi:hypothetical protein
MSFWGPRRSNRLWPRGQGERLPELCSQSNPNGTSQPDRVRSEVPLLGIRPAENTSTYAWYNLEFLYNYALPRANAELFGEACTNISDHKQADRKRPFTNAGGYP